MEQLHIGWCEVPFVGDSVGVLVVKPIIPDEDDQSRLIRVSFQREQVENTPDSWNMTSTALQNGGDALPSGQVAGVKSERSSAANKYSVRRGQLMQFQVRLYRDAASTMSYNHFIPLRHARPDLYHSESIGPVLTRLNGFVLRVAVGGGSGEDKVDDLNITEYHITDIPLEN